jgi:hypothetical protein
MSIEILDDWNERIAAGCGCCEMPACPVPERKCESVNGYADASGLFLDGDGVRHAKKVYTGTGSDTDATTDDVYMVWDGFGFSGTTTGADYTDWKRVVVDALVFTEQYDPPIETSICGNTVRNVYSYFCSGTKSVTTTTYTGVYKTAPSVDYSVFPTQIVEEISTPVAGEERQEHIDWVAEWTDEPTWQAAHDAWVIVHAEWVADFAQWEIDHEQWVVDFNAWVDGGEIGDPPVEPIAPVEPVEPPAEPDEFYPPCTYKTETTTTLYEISVNGSDQWVSSMVGVPDVSVTYSTLSPSPINPTITYEIPVTKEDVTAALLGLFTALDFDDCPSKGTSCAATGVVGEFQQSATKARFRWVIPQDWGDIPTPGTYFKITWDIATYPTDPEAEISYVQDLTWEWTGPGDPEDADSWKSPWFEISTPGDPGERKVVNIRFECYRSPQYGNKPQITGDSEDITDDVPLQRRFTSDRHSINTLLV